jgi:hypothetical protein
MHTNTDNQSQTIISLETRALERWCNGDPSGFLEISAADVVYFDPFVECRIDGRIALASYYEPLRGKIKAVHFELINPQVQLTNDAAILTFNFKSQNTAQGELRWNCTEVYRFDPEGWRIIQSHWSLTQAGRK